MRVEREIEGIALPFAAGVALSVYSGAAPSYAALSLLPILPLLLPAHRKWPPAAVRFLLTLCTFGCGLLIGATANILEISSLKNVSSIRGLGFAMQDIIDSIPFRNTETNAVIKALLTGEKNGLSRETAEAFRASGASHILALSGLHLGIIYGIVSKCLQFPGNHRKVRIARSIICILTCGIYTLATGAGASITRAFIFILIGEIARLTGRYHSTAYILSVTLIIHLTISPGDIRSVGFQLSYLAMFGIAYLYQHIRRFWPGINDPEGRKGIMQRIWDAAALSISCQLTTGPVAWLYFGTFPQYFLLTNLISMPLTGILIPMAVLTVLLSTLGILPQFLVTATEWVSTLLIQSIGIIASM
ncbi:MAG: ComEC/Rec2 family competence protein [Bacteroidales bacterium]|nr:ComEC/Rec2 family competence protein [Bacteroidales bacterium]